MQQRAGDLPQLAADDPERSAQLQDQAGIDDVLRGHAEMHIFPGVARTGLLQGAHGRHQRMSGDAQLTQHLAPVDGLITRFGRDLARGAFGDHAEFRLRQRQRRLHIEPALHARHVIEHAAHLFG